MKEINCKNCFGCDIEDLEEVLFCYNNNYILWNPKDNNYCIDCPMWATPSSGTTKCVRHAEPCWKNPLFSNMNKWEEFKRNYKARFKTRYTIKLEKTIEKIKKKNKYPEKCLICETKINKSRKLVCSLCKHRLYWWYHYDKNIIPCGWIEDLEKNPIIKKNLNKYKYIKKRK